MLKNFWVTVKTLTPVHIGSGKDLQQDFDFVVHNGQTWVLNVERIFEEQYTADPGILEKLYSIPPGQLLKKEELRYGSPFVRYSLVGAPAGREIREALKDARDRPYIPGTSLKGAIRTVLAWRGWTELGLSLQKVSPRTEKKFAARPIEAKIFGEDPHHDLLRALRIADSEPCDPECLEIVQVRVWTRGRPAAPISVEAIRPNTTFPLQITLDEALFSPWAGQEQGFPLRHREWLTTLSEAAWTRANALLRSAQTYWHRNGLFKDVLASLITQRQQLKTSAAPGFPLCLGFGVGWEGMTLGPLLKEDPAWPRIFRELRISRGNVSPEEFPRSRRVVVNGQGRPVSPLGWVWVEWKEG